MSLMSDSHAKPLFCSIAMAERIERAEAQLIAAGVEPALGRNPDRAFVIPVAARLADAARAGCDVAVATTAPGSKSQQNVQRQGFHLLYTRAVLVRDTE